MKKSSTQYLVFIGNDNPVQGKQRTCRGLMPKKQTLDFLMQFARVYHEETKLPKEISGIILN